MPADAWALPFAVGECSYPVVRRDPREAAGGIQEPQSRGDMAGQGSGRIDDTLLVRDAQRGNRAASRSWCGTTTKPYFGLPCTSRARSMKLRMCIRKLS